MKPNNVQDQFQSSYRSLIDRYLLCPMLGRRIDNWHLYKHLARADPHIGKMGPDMIVEEAPDPHIGKIGPDMIVEGAPDPVVVRPETTSLSRWLDKL